MRFFDLYPYTNWHNVNLDWVLERIKEWGQMVEANNQAFQDLEAANESFKEYVTNYLQNLDIQAQIDDKLDRMFASGELTDYLQPYVSDTVTTWLNQNITEPVGVVIDTSLTVSGAAADSKATGNRIKAVAMTDDIKNALLTILTKVAYVDNNAQTYYNALETALFPYTPQIVTGWLYQFNDNLLSNGTEDFNFQGITNYQPGVTNKCYFHHLRVEGDSSTDPLGIYAINLENIPDLSEDFTISLWYKSVTQKRGHVFTAAIWHSDKRIPIYKVTMDNPLWTDNANASATIADTYRGIRLMYTPNNRLSINFNMQNENKAIYADLMLPESIDTTTWHHYAITRNRGILRFFFDGEIVFHIENNNPIYFANQICLGNSFGGTQATMNVREPSTSSDFYDDLYITNFAKWTSNFNPTDIVY